MAPRNTLHDRTPVVELEMRFTFEAGHALKLPNGRREKRHFHNYLLVVRITNALDGLGFVAENRVLKKIVNEYVVNELSGAWLDNIIEQPTMERLAVWVWERLQVPLNCLSSVSVSEQKEHGALATYRGPQRT